MKFITSVLIIVSCLLPMLSCSNKESEEKHKEIVFQDTLTTIKRIDMVEDSASLVQFEQTSCNDVNERGEKVISKKLYSDTLCVKVTSVLDCGAQYGGSFKLCGDTLNLILKQMPIIIKRKNGEIDSFYESQDCYCLYMFLFKISHIMAIPKIIILNGNKFRGEWKGL